MHNGQKVKNIPKYYSDRQEKHISKFLGGKVQPGSGCGAFNGGDVLTERFLIEAKTTTYSRKQIQLSLEYFTKAKKQAFEQRKPYNAIAFRFDPDGQDYYIISDSLMKKLVEFIEEREIDS